MAPRAREESRSVVRGGAVSVTGMLFGTEPGVVLVTVFGAFLGAFLGRDPFGGTMMRLLGDERRSTHKRPIYVLKLPQSLQCLRVMMRTSNVSYQ